MPAPVTHAFVHAFEVLARWRAAPAFHPDGVLYEGRADLSGVGPLPEGEVDCLVRLSKGIGTPRGAPDLLGLGVRLLHDPPVDVVASTSPGAAGWRRFVLRPARRWDGATLTSLMPWARGGRRLVAVVEVPHAGLDSPEPDVLLGRLPVTFRLRVVDRHGDVQVGTIEVLRRSARERPPLDPVLNPPESWRLAPRWLSAVRERAYVGSRRGQARPSSDRAV